MSDEEITDGDVRTGSSEPWLITSPPPPPPPAGAQPPEAGPPVSRTPVEETARLPAVDPSAFEVPPVAAGSPEVPPSTDATAVTPAVEPSPAEVPAAVESFPAEVPAAVEAAVEPSPAEVPAAVEPSSPDDRAPVSELAPEPETTPFPVFGTATPVAEVDPALADAPALPGAGAGAPAAAVTSAAGEPGEPGSAESGSAESAPDAGTADAPAGGQDWSLRRAAAAVAGTAAARAAITELREQSAWVLGAAAILVAFALAWLMGILQAFQHGQGYGARDRVLVFFEPATLSWALAILLALTLITIARKFEAAPSRSARLHEVVPAGLFLAGAAVMGSSVVGILVELSNFGNGIDAAFAGLLKYVAVLLIGTAATWWAFLELKARREESKPSGRWRPDSERPAPPT